MRTRFDLSGFWHGKLELDAPLNVAAPPLVRRQFYIPLPWNKQVEDLRWPNSAQELSGVARTLQNQNFRDVQRKFNEGRITYRRMVSIPRQLVDVAGNAGAAGRRAFLVFEGSNYRTSAVVNGKHVGTHAGGHLRFEFDVTSALQPGTNKFQILVDNHRKRDACPQEQFTWQNFGGVYRPLYLEWRPAIHIARYSVLPGRDAEGWFVDVSVDMSEPSPGRLTVELTSGREVNKAQLTGLGELRRGRVRFQDPVVWRPSLGGISQYHLVFEAGNEVVDELVGTFGFRTVEAKGESVYVNGEPTRLLGVCLHEQHPAFGNAVAGWQSMRDVRLMKQVGFNAVRAVHYPHAQEFYDACDREGMMVLAELPCWQFDNFQFNEAKVREHCVEMARTMVSQLRHHPSIIGWVIQSDSRTFDRGAMEFLTAIRDVVRLADPSRFTVSAENPYPPQAMMAVAKAAGAPAGPLPPTAALVDVVGINSNAGWHADKAEHLQTLLVHYHGLANNKPMLLTEFGAEALFGQRSLELHPWSEDFQAELLARHVRTALDLPWLAGFFIANFADIESAAVGVVGNSSRGLVDQHRRPKLSFNAVRALLAAFQPNIAITEASDPSEATEDGIVV